jgi:ATP-dependent Clp protease ATP-binding subunit ClpB
MTLELREEAEALIARRGYDPGYGARPLRRYIQREVETRIGRALIAGNIGDGARIVIDADGDELIVRWQNPADEPAAAEAVGLGA